MPQNNSAMPAASIPDVINVGGVNYCTWYYTFADTYNPWTCPYNAAFNLEYSYFLPPNTAGTPTLFIDKCLLNIWGAQQWNGGFFSLQALRPWDTNKNQGIVLSIAREGEQLRETNHPAPGVPIRSEDKIWVELQSKDTPADYSALWTMTQNKARLYSIGLWYHFTP